MDMSYIYYGARLATLVSYPQFRSVLYAEMCRVLAFDDKLITLVDGSGTIQFRTPDLVFLEWEAANAYALDHIKDVPEILARIRAM